MQRVPRSQRGGEVIEPMVSGQWFVKMDNMAHRAVQAVRTKEITIIPERFEKVWYGWLENIHDWCVSRQLWWGHRIPAYYPEVRIYHYIYPFPTLMTTTPTLKSLPLHYPRYYSQHDPTSALVLALVLDPVRFFDNHTYKFLHPLAPRLSYTSISPTLSLIHLPLPSPFSTPFHPLQPPGQTSKHY